MVETPESTKTPGLGGMLAILLLTGATLAALQVARCAQSPFGSLVTCATESPGSDAALMGGIAFVIGAGIVIAAIKDRRKRAIAPASTAKPDLFTFAESWARSTEWQERFAQQRQCGLDTDGIVEVVQELSAYHAQRRALGLRDPDDDDKKAEITNQGGTRMVLALIAFVWAAWVLSGPIGCVGDRTRRCASPEPGDLWIAGLGIAAAGLWVIWRTPAAWSGWRPQQQRDLPAPVDWIADEWIRLIAAGRQPTGENAGRRGALIAGVVADYMQIARAAGIAKSPLDVAADFGGQIADVADAYKYAIRSERELQYPRGLIAAALYVMIATTDNPKRQSSTRLVLTMLEDYLSLERYAEVSDVIKGAERESELLAEVRRNWKPGTPLDATAIRAFAENNIDREALSALMSERGRLKALALERLEERLGDTLGGTESFGLWLTVLIGDVVDTAERLAKAIQTAVEAGHISGPGRTGLYDELERGLERLGVLLDETTDKATARRNHPTLIKLQGVVGNVVREAGLVCTAIAKEDLRAFALGQPGFTDSVDAMKRFRDDRYANMGAST